MKITFKDKINLIKEKDAIFVSVDEKNKDEIFIEKVVTEKNNKKNNMSQRKILHLKCDELEKMTLRKLHLLIRKMVILSKKVKAKKIVFDFKDFKFKNNDLKKLTDKDLGEIIGLQLDFANYEFNDYKTPPKDGFNLINDVIILGCDKKEFMEAILYGDLIAKEVNKSRTLSNIPGVDMTPRILAEKAKTAIKGLPIKLTILGEKEMAKKNMNAVLAVGRGSDEESKFIILEYFGLNKKEKPIVLVGKGVTFDTGGINIKPTGHLLEMNMDMSGGAAVIHTIIAIAKNKLKKNVIGLIPAVENMPSGKAYRPGDVIKSMSGKNIEILNTDAEGRVILADALTYAQKYNPKIIIDVATLTGAAIIAIGERASALFSNDDDLAKAIENAGEKTGEYIWRFPIWEEYEEDIKGNVGDITNTHNKNSYYGGAINGAMFLYQFVKDFKTKWAHLDIAPRMVSIPDDYLSKGATGVPIKLLYKLIETFNL